MVEIKIDNGENMAKCINAITSLIDEANLEFSSEGMRVFALENSSIALVDFNMPRSAFSKFEVKENDKLGIDFDMLQKILSRARAGDSVTLKKENEEKLSIILSNQTGSRKFKTNSIKVNREAKKINLKPEVEFKINKSIFENALKDTLSITEVITISVSKEGLKISATGSGLEIEGMCDSQITSENKIKGTFNFAYLNSMIKGCDKDNDISIKLANDEPISLSYTIGDANINFVLAPYMEGE